MKHHNTAPQARFLMSTTILLLAASMLLLASLNLAVPLTLLGLCFLGLLYRVVRRIILQRLDLYEVPTHLVDSDPLGPMIDRAITGKTIRLDQCEEEAPYGTR